MRNDEVFGIAQAACRIAERGASEFLTRNNLTANPEALAACLRSWTKLVFPEAMRDAKECAVLPEGAMFKPGTDCLYQTGTIA